MTDSGPNPAFEDRVILLTPTGADTEVAASLLSAVLISSTACKSIAEVCEQLSLGAAAVLIAEEALISVEINSFIECLANQPAWSDLPLIVLTTRADDGHSTAEITRLFQSVGNMVLLERPFGVSSLISTVQTALRARRKQYEVRTLLRYEREAHREREQLLAAERAARSEAEHASRMKDEFLATVSHELRTPLNAILGWSQLLRHEHVTKQDMQHGLETIERNARAQTQLIEDLLDMSRIVSGKLRLDVRSLEPAEFIDAAIETVLPAAQAKNIRIDKMLDPAASPIAGDAGRLQQVVWNLLSNAIKFTPKGGKVQVALERIDSHVEIRVADTGRGVRPDLLAHVFERFRQGDSSTTRTYGGLGLGLAIVKHLAELHGGTVRAESAGEDQGSTFTVSIPISVAHMRTSSGRSQHTDEASYFECDRTSLEGLKVLAIDDETDARELVARMLSQCGAEVRTCASASEALDVYRAFGPDVVVSDIGMPGTDGYEFLRRLRETGSRTPAIALTAFARTEDRTRALLAGYRAHVSKPVEPAELIATIASVAGRT